MLTKWAWVDSICRPAVRPACMAPVSARSQNAVIVNQQGRRAALGIILAVMVLGVVWGAMQSRSPIDDATQGRTPIDVASLGPQVGEQVPAFSLPDQNGRVRTLDSILGRNGAILLFHRSADW